MRNPIAELSLSTQRRLEELAQELALHGLGISSPHMHGPCNEIARLPEGIVAYEADLKVDFRSLDKVPEHAVAVGWRWSDGKLSVFAGCCGNQPPDRL